MNTAYNALLYLILGVQTLLIALVGLRQRHGPDSWGDRWELFDYIDRVLAFLARVPISCWWWSLLTAYLSLAWFVAGPRYTRWLWAAKHKSDAARTETERAAIKNGADEITAWLFAPVWLLLWTPSGLLFRALDRLIYGNDTK